MQVSRYTTSNRKPSYDRWSGMLQLHPGDAIFVRDKFGSGDPHDDVLQAYVADKYVTYALHSPSVQPDSVYSRVLSQPQLTRLRAARDSALGPRNERTPDKPAKSSSAKGGTRWERDCDAEPVGSDKKHSRAYTLGYSYENQPKMAAPSVGCKIRDGEVSEHQLIRKELIDVSVVYFVKCLLTRLLGGH